jgi:hypothetical protein
MKNNTNHSSKLKTLVIPAAAGLAALLAPPAGAVDALLTVDSYVSASQPAANFGNVETLQVGSGNRALLRFDVASMLPAGTIASQVSKAVLNVWVSGITKSGSVEVSELLGAWTEPGVTGATVPGVGAAFTTKAVFTVGRWVPIVVTSQVKKWLNTPSTNNGVLIAPAAAAPNTAVALDSKENTATSHAARLEIELTGHLGGSYMLTVGKLANDNTGRIQQAVPDFTTITAALNKIPNNIYNATSGACGARYLVKVLPGVYNERVTMKPCVDIEGSGELTTTITAAGGANPDATAATVIGANVAELRFLTVENTGGYSFAYAIYNSSASPRLTHVTATVSGGSSSNIGVENYSNSSPAMTNVTATASGGATYNYGVLNYSTSSPAMVNVTATASGGTGNIGMYNDSSSPAMTNVTAIGSGSSTSYGVYNWYASPTILHSTLRGATYSLSSSGAGTVRVGASQLDGPVNGLATCTASFNGSFAALNASCQ